MEQLVPVDLDFFAVAPILVLAVATLITLIVDLILPKSRERSWLFTASLGGIAVAFYYVVALWLQLPPAGAGNAQALGAFSTITNGITAFGGAMIVDRFTLLFTAITLLSAFGTILMSGLRHDEDLSGYMALILGAALGMSVLVSAGNLLIVFLGLEILSLNLYVAVAFRPGHQGSKEAALKYLILGSVAAAIMLYGFAFLYGQTGTLSLAGLAAGWAEPTTLFMQVGLGLTLVGLAFKMALAPFHTWAPDVYEGAPSPITAFMSIGSKAAAFGILVRMIIALLPEDGMALLLPLWVLGVLSMVIGSFGAAAQTNIKRLMAYSGIGHAGYLMMALLGLTNAGLTAGTFYLLAYMVTTIGAFSVLVWLGGRGDEVETLDQIRGLFYRHPLLAALMTLFLLSLAAFPPAAGFFGKLFLILSALDSGMGAAAWWLVGALTVTAAVSAYAYLKVVSAMFRRADTQTVRAVDEGTDGDTVITDDGSDGLDLEQDSDVADAPDTAYPADPQEDSAYGLGSAVISGAGGPPAEAVSVSQLSAEAESSEDRFGDADDRGPLPFSWPLALVVALAAIGTLYMGLFPRAVLEWAEQLLPLM